MLCRRHIAEERSSIGSCNGPANGTCDMVIARRHIRDKRSQHIKGRSLAHRLLDLHIGTDLIQRHVPRPLDHHLDIVVPGALCQLAQRHQFRDLGNIPGVLDASRTAGIPKTNGHIIFLTDIQKFIIPLVKWIFISRQLHPGKNDRTAAGNNIRMAQMLLETVCCGTVDPAVDRHKINPVLCVHLNYIHPLIRCDILQCLVIINHRIVDWHCPDHRRTLVNQLSPEFLRISIRTQIHDRLSPHIHSGLYLPHLYIQIQAVTACSQIYIDLCLQPVSNTIGFETFVILVCRDRNLSFGNQIHQNILVHSFVFTDALHRIRKDSFSRGIHLRCIIHQYNPPFTPGIV